MSLNQGKGRLQSPPSAPVRVKPGTWNRGAGGSSKLGSREAGRGAPGQQSLGGDLRTGPFPQLPGAQALAGPQSIALNTWLYLHLNRTSLSGWCPCAHCPGHAN